MTGSTEKRRAYLEELKLTSPQNPAWEEWLERTGELPPDFDTLPSCADLPDPLLTEVDGKTVRIADVEQWRARRQELRKLLQHWIVGSIPPPPDNLAVEVLEEHVNRGVTIRQVRLSFGPDRSANFRLKLLIPPGKGPFPVFMTQQSHRTWALIALRRGYISCVYAGADVLDDTTSFVDAYPDCDWTTLNRRGYAASRALDYLTTLPEADESKVCITGHSRNGKLAVTAAAMDERFAVLIASSAGGGGDLAVRASRETIFAEFIEPAMRGHLDWYHPRLRFFVGREQKLPTDLHHLVALMAPRPTLMSIAINDQCTDARAAQRTYLSIKPVWEMLEKSENLRILWRSGNHDTNPEIIERYIDWCDNHFRGSSFEFPERTFLPYDWDAWRQSATIDKLVEDFPESGLDDLLKGADGQALRGLSDWPERKEGIRSQVLWMLGEQPAAPPEADNPGDDYGREYPYRSWLFGRANVPGDLEKHRIVIGEYINMDVFAPEGAGDAGRRRPTMLYLAPANCSTGYVEENCGRQHWWQTVARAGFVFAGFDPIGTGNRVEEAERFYKRHPDWSLLGKMIRDARSALSVLRTLPYVDPERIFVCGFAMGAFVALHLAALDDRISGLITLCPPGPFRLDADEAETGGLRRWSHTFMLLPKLGLFIGNESRVPYDVHQLLACAAPKPQLVINPKLDHEAPAENVTRAVQAAREVYELHGAADSLEQLTTDDHACFSVASENLILNWFRKQSGK